MIKDEIVVFPAREYTEIRRAAGKQCQIRDEGFIAVHCGTIAHAITSQEALEKCYNKASQNTF